MIYPLLTLSKNVHDFVNIYPLFCGLCGQSCLNAYYCGFFIVKSVDKLVDTVLNFFRAFFQKKYLGSQIGLRYAQNSPKFRRQNTLRHQIVQAAKLIALFL